MDTFFATIDLKPLLSMLGIIIDPLLAILVIFIPLGLAYAILLFQSQKPLGSCRKISAITYNDLVHIRTELSRAERKHAARQCHAGTLDLS